MVPVTVDGHIAGVSTGAPERTPQYRRCTSRRARAGGTFCRVDARSHQAHPVSRLVKQAACAASTKACRGRGAHRRSCDSLRTGGVRQRRGRTAEPGRGAPRAATRSGPSNPRFAVDLQVHAVGGAGSSAGGAAWAWSRGERLRRRCDRGPRVACKRTDAAHLEVPAVPDGVSGTRARAPAHGRVDLYNAALEQRIWAWRHDGVSITFREQSKQLTEARQELRWLDGMNALAQHGVLRRLERAFQAFYRRVGAGQTPASPVQAASRVSLAHLAAVRQRRSGSRRRASQRPRSSPRRRPREVPRTPTLPRERQARPGDRHSSAEWSLVADDRVSRTLSSESRRGRSSLSGSTSASTRSPRSQPANASPGRTPRAARRELRRAHRKVSRRQKGSRSRRRAARDLARAQENVSGTRRTHHHTVARRLVRQHSVLAIEDLHVGRLTRSARGTVERPGSRVRQKAGLNREILDQGLGAFRALP
jgi:putative transposase